MIYKTNQHSFSIHSNKKLIEALSIRALKRATDSKKAGIELFATFVTPTFGVCEINKAEEESFIHPSICI